MALTEHQQPATAPRSLRTRYLALAKVDVPDYWYGPIVAWSCAASPFGWVVVPASMLVTGVAGGNWAAAALDDIQGLADGIDEITYSSENTLRSRNRKPLLTGELTADEARLFASACVLGSMGVSVAAFGLSPHRPLRLVPIGLAGLLLSVQYSYGLKLSYRPGGAEASLFGTMMLVTAGPGYLFGAARPALWAATLLLSSTMTQSAMAANGQDAVADAAGGRRTIATLLTSAQYGRLIALLSVVDLAVALGAVGLGALHPITALTLTPAAVCKARQAHSAWQGDWLRARRRGFTALRMIAGGIIAGNLVGRALR
ncbi:UbiA family prenyltransferase [Antrihabitans stalactiti]|uniref:1,4-dihydroxy-2-naphthoate octaprenyltransferase n=1 Tax=Antrihabitans stalactiti TaxID=2584121 RepID=A0A848KBB6_9NOCA|nr:UbiA family prenyltransferase [Antrihabitans stalactiti]NMN96165.1 hypothetical protein [Antrihabitans stalactiti]